MQFRSRPYFPNIYNSTRMKRSSFGESHCKIFVITIETENYKMNIITWFEHRSSSNIFWTAVAFIIFTNMSPPILLESNVRNFRHLQINRSTTNDHNFRSIIQSYNRNETMLIISQPIVLQTISNCVRNRICQITIGSC